MANQIDYDYDEVIAYIPKAPAGAVEELATNLNTLGNNLTALQEECHSGTNSSSVFTQVYAGFSNIIGDSNKGLGGLTTSAANIMNVSYQEALIDKQIAEGGENVSALYAKRDALTADVTTGSNSPSGSNARAESTTVTFYRKLEETNRFDGEDVSFNYYDTEGTPQGYTQAGKYNIVSSYIGSNPSTEVLYYYDRATGEYIGSQTLPVTGHAGGSAYDPETGVLYVTKNNGKVYAYDYVAMQSEIKPGMNLSAEEMEKYTLGYVQMPVSESMASIAVHDGTLYSSTCAGHRGVGFQTDISNIRSGGKTTDPINNQLPAETTKAYITPTMVQGIAVNEYNGKTYEIYSQSTGIFGDSKYVVYEVKDDGTVDYIGKYTEKRNGIEGIYLNDSGKLTSINESSIQDSKTVDMEKIINGCSKEEDNLYERAVKYGYDEAKDGYTYDDYCSAAKNNDDLSSIMVNRS